MRIEFYLFVSQSVMKERRSTCKFRKSASCITKFTHGPSVFHTAMRNKQVEFNPEINYKIRNIIFPTVFQLNNVHNFSGIYQ